MAFLHLKASAQEFKLSCYRVIGTSTVHGTSRPVKECVESDKIQNEKFLPAVGVELTMLYRKSYPGFDESCPIKVTFIHACASNTNVYIGISFRMMKYM